MPIKGQASIEESSANDFVDSVVAADVFPNGLGRAGEGKKAGRVNSTGAGELTLLLSQEIGESKQRFHFHSRLVV